MTQKSPNTSPLTTFPPTQSQKSSSSDNIFSFLFSISEGGDGGDKYYGGGEERKRIVGENGTDLTLYTWTQIFDSKELVSI